MTTSPVEPAVPLGVRICAYAVPLCILPSAVWRLVDAALPTIRGTEPCTVNRAVESVYIPSLSVVSLSLGLLTIGLVRPWGEVFPRWIPGLGGRRVNPRVVTACAYAGAVALTLIMLGGFLGGGQPRHTLPPGCHQPGWEVLRWYLPLPLWPVLLAIVARDYQKRHRGSPSVKGCAASGPGSELPV